MWHRRLFSLVFWVFLVTTSIVLFPVALVIWATTLPFDRRQVLLHRFTCFWASLYTWFNPAWKVSIDGREPESVRHALRILSSYQPGESLELHILREKKKRTLDVAIPDDRRGMIWAPAPAPRPAVAPRPAPAPKPLSEKT